MEIQILFLKKKKKVQYPAVATILKFFRHFFLKKSMLNLNLTGHIVAMWRFSNVQIVPF